MRKKYLIGIGIIVIICLIGGLWLTQNSSKTNSPSTNKTVNSSVSKTTSSSTSKTDSSKPSKTTSSTSSSKEAETMLKPEITTENVAVYTMQRLASLSHKTGMMTATVNGKQVSVKLPENVTYIKVTDMTPSPAVDARAVHYKLNSNSKDIKAYSIDTTVTKDKSITKISDNEYLELSNVRVYLTPDDYTKYMNNETFKSGQTSLN